MAIDNQMTVDGIGKSNNADELVLLIADHLTWDDEKQHLTLLQGKLNAYAMFIESKQYSGVYPDEEFNSFLIQIMFLHEPTDKAVRFLSAASDHLKQFSIIVQSDKVAGA